MALIVVGVALIVATCCWGAAAGWPHWLILALSANVVLLSALSYLYWRPSLSFVKDQTRVASWDRLSKFQVDERLAELLRADKIKIIREQRRQRGGHPS